MSANANSSPRSARAWLLLTFGHSRQYAGNLGYEDDPSRVYRYDSFVPNHRKLASGDVAVLQGSEGVIGYTHIERIDSWDGTKKRSVVPIVARRPSRRGRQNGPSTDATMLTSSTNL
jgi:hypothetical protein